MEASGKEAHRADWSGKALNRGAALRQKIRMHFYSLSANDGGESKGNEPKSYEVH